MPHRSRRRHVRVALWVPVIATAWISLQGFAAAGPGVPSVGISVERIDTSPSLAAQPPGDAAPQVLRTRWWVGGGVGVGVGIDWASSARANVSRPMLGVHADIASQTRLIYEVRTGSVAASPSLDGVLAGAAPRDRWTLEVRQSQSAAQQLRSSLFRLELSGASAVTLRPRRGGVSVAWQSQF